MSATIGRCVAGFSAGGRWRRSWPPRRWRARFGTSWTRRVRDTPDHNEASPRYDGSVCLPASGGAEVPMRVSRLIGFAVVALLLLAGPQAIRLYTDWLWFGEVGYQSVFSTIWATQSLLFVVAFVGAVAWFGVNIRLALSSIGDRRPTFVTRDGTAVPFPEPEQIWRVLMALATVISLLFGLAAAGRWETWLTWRNQVAFGQADPILNIEVAYYVFSLPMWQFVRGVAQALAIAAGLVSLALYFVTGSLTSGFPSRVVIRGSVRRHLALLGAAFFLLLAW